MVQRAASRVRSKDVSHGISFDSASVSKLVASYLNIEIITLVNACGAVQCDIEMERCGGDSALAKQFSRLGREGVWGTSLALNERQNG